MELVSEIKNIDVPVMGGGNGISVFGSHRIGNFENYTFAMPETSIGLYPDVGGCYFLSRYPSNIHIGLYLGLTGKINYFDIREQNKL
jgi:enoyl-CoA hydratase